MVLRMHPDKSKAPDAEHRFRELQAVSHVLSDARRLEPGAGPRSTHFGAVYRLERARPGPGPPTRARTASVAVGGERLSRQN